MLTISNNARGIKIPISGIKMAFAFSFDREKKTPQTMRDALAEVMPIVTRFPYLASGGT